MLDTPLRSLILDLCPGTAEAFLAAGVSAYPEGCTPEAMATPEDMLRIIRIGLKLADDLTEALATGAVDYWLRDHDGDDGGGATLTREAVEAWIGNIRQLPSLASAAVQH
jgi:hypothetical protein